MKGVFGNIGAQDPFTLINDAIRNNIKMMRMQSSWRDEEYDRILLREVGSTGNVKGQWSNGCWYVCADIDHWGSPFGDDVFDVFTPHLITMMLESPNRGCPVPVLKTYMIPINIKENKYITPETFASALGNIKVISTRIRMDLCERYMQMKDEWNAKNTHNSLYSNIGIAWESAMPITKYSDKDMGDALYLNLADQYVYICPMVYARSRKFADALTSDPAYTREQKNYAYRRVI